jgi:hypothetical protein
LPNDGRAFGWQSNTIAIELEIPIVGLLIWAERLPGRKMGEGVYTERRFATGFAW